MSNKSSLVHFLTSDEDQNLHEKWSKIQVNLALIALRWSAEPVTFDRVMLWAAFCLVFFGFMHATGASLCPVLAMLAYLARRPGQPAPLFMFRDGLPLSRPKLVQRLREALNSIGVDDSGFSGHSFQIGAATAAARAGLSDSLIKTLGRWKSSAFSLYIRTPARQLAAASTALAAASTPLAGTTLT